MLDPAQVMYFGGALMVAAFAIIWFAIDPMSDEDRRAEARRLSRTWGRRRNDE